jgi:proton-translocating NADH-quinone oxidoreductase chain L
MLSLATIFFPIAVGILLVLSKNIIKHESAVEKAFFSILITAQLATFSFFLTFLDNTTNLYFVLSWIKLGPLTTNILFLYDPLTNTMLLVVSLIASCVIIYSVGYMEKDPDLPLFLGYLLLFVGFMIIFVSAGNFPVMFIGWEGIGLLSYLLINFWHTRNLANLAALKAIFVNKIGDLCLYIVMGAVFYQYCTLDYIPVFLLADKDDYLIHTIAVTLVLAAAVKSAQILLHTWLPDAMEGPTPVSALLHAATMVTAGIYLIIRCATLIEQSYYAQTLCIFIGSLTCLFAASIGPFQMDIKRIIAFSTCSQLGYMFMICGLSGYNFAMFHLFNHAFFKALLFLSAGSIIHGLNDEQDLRRMGGNINILPLTYICFVIGTLALIGFPFLSGFTSKDGILELAFATHYYISYFAFTLGLIAAILSTLYSVRLLYLCFFDAIRTNKKTILHAHELNPYMGVALITLAIASIFSGFLCRDFFIGSGTQFWGTSIIMNQTHPAITDFEFIPTTIKLIPLLCILIGGIIFYVLKLYGNILTENKLFNSIYAFFSNKWYIDQIYNYFLVKPLLFFGQKVTFDIIDRGFLESFGPYGLVKIFSIFLKKYYNAHSGNIHAYLFIFILGIVIVIGTALLFTL